MKKRIALLALVTVIACCLIVIQFGWQKTPATNMPEEVTSVISKPTVNPSSSSPMIIEPVKEPYMVLPNIKMPDVTTSDVNISDFGLTRYEELSLDEDFFLSSKGQEAVLIAYKFFCYYILGDISAMQRYLLDPDNHYPVQEFIFDNGTRTDWHVTHLNLFRIRMWSLDEIEITFEYDYLPNESFNYIAIYLIFQDEQWKVDGFAIQK